MIPKIHAKGHSFRGVATYVLHDKDKATTDDRVAWTQTRNLATDDPHVAWRVMAATALDQDRLKEAAGKPKTGRKSSAHVLHYTLSWHEDEALDLTQEEMMRAVEDSLAALGKSGQTADQHQVLVVCHDDEPQPHVHVVVNRVHPEHGVMLASSQDRLKLSRWAEAYEKERGKVLCEQRVKNNEARDRGEYVKGEGNEPRHLYELRQQFKDHPELERIVKEQRDKDLALRRRERATLKQHQDESRRLRESQRNAKRQIEQRADRDIGRAREAVKRDFEPRWKKLYATHQRELNEFGKREKRLIGRIQNAIAAIDFRAILRSDDRGAAIRGVFSALASKGVRLEALEKSHTRQSDLLAQQQRGATRRAVAAIRKRLRETLSVNRQQFLGRRDGLLATQAEEKQVIEEAWTSRRDERLKAYNAQAAVRNFNASARNVDPRKGRKERKDPAVTKRNPDPRKRRGRGRDRGRKTAVSAKCSRSHVYVFDERMRIVRQ